MMKITVGVEVGVSVGVAVGKGVEVDVIVGDGITRAVCVCAAPAVATTIVSTDPGAGEGLDTGGVANKGTSHARMTRSATQDSMYFLTAFVSMIIQHSYLTVKENLTVQNSVLPIFSPHLVL